MEEITCLKDHYLAFTKISVRQGAIKEYRGREGAGTVEKGGGGFCERQRVLNSHVFSSIFPIFSSDYPSHFDFFCLRIISIS